MTEKKKESNEYFVPINGTLTPHIEFGRKVMGGIIDKIIDDGGVVVTGAFTPKENLDNSDMLDARIWIIDDNEEFWDLNELLTVTVDINAKWKERKEDCKQ